MIGLRIIPSADYAHMWGCWEGVRELVQNWHDGIYDTKALLEEQDRSRPDNRKNTCEDYEVKFDKVRMFVSVLLYVYLKKMLHM